MTRVIGRARRGRYAGVMLIQTLRAPLTAAVLMVTALVATGCQRDAATNATTSTPAATATAAHPPAASAESGPGGWFVKTGCTKCHAVTVYDLKSETNIGPDLSI